MSAEGNVVLNTSLAELQTCEGFFNAGMLNESEYMNLVPAGSGVNTANVSLAIIVNQDEDPGQNKMALNGKNPMEASQKTTKATDYNASSDQDKAGPTMQQCEPDSEKPTLLDRDLKVGKKHSTEQKK